MIDRRLALAGAVLAALALAGCGDSDDQPEPIATAEDAAPPAPATDLAPPAAVAAEPAAVATPGAVAAPAEPQAPAPVVPAAPAPEPVGPAAVAGPAPQAEPPAGRTLEERLAAADPAEGEVYLMQCEICHSIEEGRPAGVGPNLFNVVGAPVGRDPAFNYSPAFAALRTEGATWTPERLDAFLAAPGAEIPGTRMGFGGFADPETRADVIAWLATLIPSATPVANDAPPPPQIIGVEVAGLGPVTFVAVQADVGADLYASLRCGTCHGADMRGGTGPALVGTEFAERWFGRPMSDLFAALRTMPPDAAGTQPDARYLELAAAILAGNGFLPGASPLRANPAILSATGFYQVVPAPDQRNR